MATVVGALTQAVLPALILPRVRRDLQPPEVAQPAPWAFAIWLPVYAAAAVHAARQARPALRNDPVLRDAGWPLAAAYLCIGGWAPLLQRQRYWAAQGALTGAAAFAGVARTRLDRTDENRISTSMALSTGLLSGWGAAACGVNLASMAVGVGPVPTGRPTMIAGAATALALGGLGAATLPQRATTLTQRTYAATLLWALVGVAAGQRRASPSTAAAGMLATVPIARRLLTLPNPRSPEAR
ncbi:MAG: hypothetical protein ABJA89_15180 [Lapillicoccus sp.]